MIAVLKPHESPIDQAIRAVVANRAAIYVRVSDPKQEDGNSLKTQEDEARAHCAAHSYAIDEAHVYREVHTASELWQRDDLGRLRQAARERAFDVVIIHCQDRFSRNQAHTYILAYELEQLGIRLEFVLEKFEDTAIGRFMRSAKAFAAELELERIRERTTRNVRARGASGKLLAGNKPVYGYRFVDAPIPPGADERTISRNRKVAYTVYEPEAKWVRWMFDRAAHGTSGRRIAIELTDAGVPRPSGKPGPWADRTVLWLLKNPFYTGEGIVWRWTTRKNSKGRESMVARPPEEWIRLPEGTVPGIMPQATFDAVQQRLATNKARAIRNNKGPELTLLRGGFARCGVCADQGRSTVMIVRRWKNKRADGSVTVVPTYRCAAAPQIGCTCHHSITASVLDDAVWTRIAHVLTKPEVVEQELRRTQQNDPTERDLAALDRALTDLARRLRILAGNLSLVEGEAAQLVAGQLNALSRQRGDLEAEREGILARRSQWEAALSRLHDLQAWCRHVAANLTTLTYEEKRLALDALNVQAKVWPEIHTPRWEISASIQMDDQSAPPAIVRNIAVSISKEVAC